MPSDLLTIGTEHEDVISKSVFVAVLCLCVIMGHLLEENRWFNESITAILIGCITGAIILVSSKDTKSHILMFEEEIFFIYLLPPIIFNAGFRVKKKQFFRNFLIIMLFGVAGVFISFAIISAGSWWLFPKIGFDGLSLRDYLALGTICSSTDTVCTLQVLHQDETPLLYSLVFGEGVVNDATSVVLFNAIQKMDVSKLNAGTALHVFGDFLYLFSTSAILGIALLQLSGILTVFFCGIVMSHYAWYNVTEKSRITTRHTFSMLSFIAETFIFLYVGMDALDFEKWTMTKTSLLTSFGIYFVIIFLIFLVRAAFVFPLSAVSNCMSSRAERSSITFKHQFIMWWAGLIRGAVSIALAFKQFTSSGVTWNPVNATVVTSTVVVVLFTTLVFGMLTKPLINTLLPHLAQTPLKKNTTFH